MRVGIISVYVDYNRRGERYRDYIQPVIGPLIAGMLPSDIDIEVINESWTSPDWNKHYDLLFISFLHSDFDRAKQISHYWRKRGAKTVCGGTFASTYPHLCEPFFDSIVIGDPEGSVPQIYRDFCDGGLRRMYVSTQYYGSAVPKPRFDLMLDQTHLPLSIEATRGCPNRCEFCALSALGTRFCTRSPEMVARDIKHGQETLRRLVKWYKRWALDLVAFLDNNIGGDVDYLKSLCDCMSEMDILWGSLISYNIIKKEGMAEMLSQSGCRYMFVGLESFNNESLADMKKFKNSPAEVRKVLEVCRRKGILLTTGLLVNPMVDTCDYMEKIPQYLRESGFYVPTYISIECPIPGTPLFNRLASSESPVFLPNALLRDFNGYTLVTKPQRESLTRFVDVYRGLLKDVYSLGVRFRKLLDDVPKYLIRGHWKTAIADISHNSLWSISSRPHPDRTFIAGTDITPPDVMNVPLGDDDFETEEERRRVMEPVRVTDSEGKILPHWLDSKKVF
jgi:radical SAM superfamily enzyme YgiQ (UPF0313 family)